MVNCRAVAEVWSLNWGRLCKLPHPSIHYKKRNHENRFRDYGGEAFERKKCQRNFFLTLPSLTRLTNFNKSGTKR